MTDRETAGARWFREDKERRAKEAADTDRALRQKGIDALARARAARERAVQGSFDGLETPADAQRTLMSRILAEPEPRARERLEAELRVLRERMKRDATRQARGTPRGLR